MVMGFSTFDRDCHGVDRNRAKPMTFRVASTLMKSNPIDNDHPLRDSPLINGSKISKAIDPKRRDFLCSTAALSAAGTAAAILGKYGEAASASDMQGRNPSATVPEDSSALVPFSTRRKYRDVTLTNGLRVLLVSDKKVPLASAAMSIGGAGQFSDPEELPGLAHMMEHMVLSSSGRSSRRGGEYDFEEWLGEHDGASNAFTAPGMVCFHFNAPPEWFAEALDRFSLLFMPDAIEKVCKSESTLKREARRIDGELDFRSDASRGFYLLKDRTNPDHPFSFFSAGSLETLETRPQEVGIDVGGQLMGFFNKNYLPQRAVLVVVGPEDLRTLERWIAPFATALSQNSVAASKLSQEIPKQYPEPFPNSSGIKLTQTILLRSKDDPLFNENVETLSFEWPLDLQYHGLDAGDQRTTVTATGVGFIIAQILGRRGPGSLYRFLLRRGWVKGGNKVVPRISFPVDVSGFQILKMEIGLTVEGFANRSAVIAAIYKSIRDVALVSQSVRPFLLPRELFVQYLTVATLHGYIFAPRPPDAVELAVDAQTYGMGMPGGVGVEGLWPLMPSRDDVSGMEEMRKIVAATLATMSDPSKAIITITASAKAMFGSSSGIIDQPIPPLISGYWQTEPVTGAPYYIENAVNIPGLAEPLVWLAEKLDDNELGPPVLNPLVPPRLRPARPILERRGSDGGRRYFYLETSNVQDAKSTSGRVVLGETLWREFVTQSPEKTLATSDSIKGTWEERALATIVGRDWKLWQSPPGSREVLSLPLPLIPPEPSCRCSFVVQLLSRRPARATVKQAAYGELWRLSFDDDVIDLAELGATAGLAYETSFNAYGLRICFRGISQTLPSYARRFCRRLVEHHVRLEDSSATVLPSTVDAAVAQVNRLTSASQFRKL